jgi:hypothetical protein
VAGALAEQALEDHMCRAGFSEVERLEISTLDVERLRYYPLFTMEFLDWMEAVLDRDGAPPIYRVHLRGHKPAVE